MGTTNKPFYRLVVADSRFATTGRFLEILGWYDPKQADKNFSVKLDRVNYWIGTGAQISNTAKSLVKKAKAGEGVEPGAAPEKKAPEAAVSVPDEAPVAEETPAAVEESVEASAKEEAEEAKPDEAAKEVAEPVEEKPADVSAEAVAEAGADEAKAEEEPEKQEA